jgi:predicted Zn-dependent protease
MKAVCQTFLFLLLAGCATTSQPEPDAWLLNPDWTRVSAFIDSDLKGKSGQTYPVAGMHVQNLRTVLLALGERAQVDHRVALMASDAPNAFAVVHNGNPVIGLTLPMLNLIGADKDALAATLGHELAHLKLKHGDVRKQRTESAQGVSRALGAVLSIAGIPFGGTLANIGVGVVTSAYSRDEERDADELGLRWALAAGYSACGSARTMRLLMEKNNVAPLPFLASHPGHEERIERANKTALAATGTAC